MADLTILLPTYNRARFLPDAFKALAAQTFTDWKLIVLDDGSTDGTADLVRSLGATLSQPMTYHWQENAGLAAVRNRLVELCDTERFAFYDSDDLWLPHHLADLSAAMDRFPELDWVWGTCLRQTFDEADDYESAMRIAASTPDPLRDSRPYFQLACRREGELFIIDDPRATELAIEHNHFGGMQASMFQRRIFDQTPPFPVFGMGEDLAFGVRAMARGCRMAYYNRVHVVYREHTTQTSASRIAATINRRIEVQREYVRAIEWLRDVEELTDRQRRALERRILNERFWTLGYALYWQNGRVDEAMAAFRQALRDGPCDLGCWKSYLLCRLRAAMGWKGAA